MFIYLGYQYISIYVYIFRVSITKSDVGNTTGKSLIRNFINISSSYDFAWSEISNTKKIKAMLGMLGSGENSCGWLFMMELLPLGYHCVEDMTKQISVSQRQDPAAGTQTAEPLVILTACLFSFVVGEHEMRPSGTCHHLNYYCRWKILLILINLNKKQGINTKKILFFGGKQGILAS